jgi:hypothetical protein
MDEEYPIVDEPTHFGWWWRRYRKPGASWHPVCVSFEDGKAVWSWLPSGMRQEVKPGFDWCVESPEHRAIRKAGNDRQRLASHHRSDDGEEFPF